MDYKNNFLFSEAYIHDAFEKMKKYAQEYDEIFDNLCSWYQEYKNDWLQFEDVALDTLGFDKEEDGDYRWIRFAGNTTAALVYLLDKDCSVGSTLKGKYYVVDAIKKAKERDVAWVIVTNGFEWRLLYTSGVSPYEHSFSVNIENALEAGKAGISGHIFVHIFGARAFKTNETGAINIDVFKNKSDESEENIEDILRSKAESILTGLCYGLKDNMNRQSFTIEDKKQIYEDAIILLYRLLFLGYAESRGLLPVRADDPDYLDSFSMLCQTAKDYYLKSKLTENGNDFDLWDRLDSQLRIYVDKNYNGGLFSNDNKPILKEYRIANKHLAPCLMELAYISGRKKDYAQKIEYKDLSVRNLGAIYEGLLEYQLFIADELMVQRKSKEKVAYIKASETTLKNSDKNNLVQPGEIYLSQDAMERKETGAYYTPEDVVDYIVKNTVGKKLEELKKELDKDLSELLEEQSYEPVEQRRKQIQNEIDERTVEFINEKILSLSIVDSAMGSGHFLVNAAYQVSNYIVDILEGHRWENKEINADVTYWRRKVVENCIYGIDINNLSVSLARLSLWLISATNDKALSFVDHHLKCGNSIVGTTTDKVQYINMNAPLFNMTKEQYMSPILEKYELIKKIGSDTKADVAMQHQVYEEISSELALIKRKMDYYLASMYAGEISEESEFERVMCADNLSLFESTKLKPLMEYADINRFFHWELEFPEVFIKGGFDVAIGNPPYVECQSEPYSQAGLSTIECRNLYAYMMEKSIKNVKDDGKYGFIIPIASMYSNNMKPLQDFLLDKNTVYISNFATRPSKIFRKAEQRLSIIIGALNVDNPSVYSTTYNRWYAEDRKKLFSNLKYVKVDNPRRYKFVPKIGCEIENAILEKLTASNSRLGDYLVTKDFDKSFVYHSVGRYWLKAFDFMPKFLNEKTGATVSTKYKSVGLKPGVSDSVVICLINSSLFYWYWIMMSAERDFTKRDIENLPFDYNGLDDGIVANFDVLKDELMANYREHSRIISTTLTAGNMVLQEFHPKHAKNILDRIDELIGKIYGFTEEEVKYICNFDLKFRMGDEED